MELGELEYLAAEPRSHFQEITMPVIGMSIPSPEYSDNYADSMNALFLSVHSSISEDLTWCVSDAIGDTIPAHVKRMHDEHLEQIRRLQALVGIHPEKPQDT